MTEAYAKSLLELILQQKDPKKLAEQVGVLLELFEQNPEYPILLSHPSIPREERMENLKQSLEFADEILLFFMQILMEDGVIAYSPEILKMFADLYESEQGIAPFIISSVVELSEDQKERIEKGLAKKFNKTIRAEYRLDPTLVGGIRIEGLGQILDYSIPARLQKMKESIL